MRAERGASRPGKLRAEPSRFPADHAERRRAPRRGRKCRGHSSPRRPVPGALHRGGHVPRGPACAAARDPAAPLPELAKRHGAYLVEINVEETPLSPLADELILGPAAGVLPDLLGT